MNIKCSKCNNKLKEMGALVFSPPEVNMVAKYHLCIDCYGKVFEYIYGVNQ